MLIGRGCTTVTKFCNLTFAQKRFTMSTFKGNLSQRATRTDESIIKLAMKYSTPTITNMAQGVAYWDPPEKVLDSIGTMARQPSVHRYGSIEGRRELTDALLHKMKTQNNITNKRIYITSGCNQAYFHVIMATCDPGDEVVLIAPYYFNHYMALQLTNVTPAVVQDLIGTTSKIDKNKSIFESDDDSDIDFILDRIRSKFTSKTKVLSIVTPGNPFSAVYSEKLLKQLQQMCESLGIWLVVDETYEDFIFEDKKHFSVDGENVINLYSFSKSYGISGWRVGYIVYPPVIKDALDKVQDTNPINCSQMSQNVAHACLTLAGKEWVDEKVKTLIKNRDAIWNAVKDIPNVIRTSGALYFLVKLPTGITDEQAIEFLSKKTNVLVLPCSGCGVEGYIRVSYGNLPFEKCEQAAIQLKQGLDELWNKH